MDKYLRGRLTTQTLVGPPVVVVGKVRVELAKQVVPVVGRVEVNVLLFDRSPKALDEGIGRWRGPGRRGSDGQGLLVRQTGELAALG